jgi:hypothetical protein
MVVWYLLRKLLLSLVLISVDNGNLLWYIKGVGVSLGSRVFDSLAVPRGTSYG